MRALACVLLCTVAGAIAQTCAPVVRIDAFVSEPVSGRFESSVTCPDGLVVFAKLAGSDRLQVNARGDYLFVPGAQEGAETATISTSCVDGPSVCNFTVAVSIARRIETATPPPTSAPADIECPQLFFNVAVGSSLSDSVAVARNQLPCTSSPTFTVARPVARGTLVLASSGDFRFDAPVEVPAAGNQYDDFGYIYQCNARLMCRGSAYITYVPTTTPPTMPTPATEVPAGSPSPQPPLDEFVTPQPYMRCRGTCNRAAWKVSHSSPEQWDEGAVRSDGRKVGSITTSWANGKLVVKSYSVIGNFASRFPTFEEIVVAAGETFSGSEVLTRVAPTSLPFDVSCLSRQSNAGLAANVWEWESVANRTGHAGRHYASGSDWYQKFGGKHVNCDTFLADACHFAPTLTPRRQQDPATGGVWSVSIDGCDVTWTGEFSFAALRSMRRNDGSPVFSMTDGHYLQTSMKSQIVKPASEVRPAAGLLTKVEERPVVLDLEPWITAEVDESNHKLFSVDVEHFLYTAANGDRAIGLNLLFYPHVEEGALSSYSPDRHVAGFRWVEQSWSHPDGLQCPTCTGVDTACSLDTRTLAGDSSFLAPDFFTGSCRSPRVALSRGQAFSAADCAASRMHNFDRPGFSAPAFCSRNFQNLTIRGIASGSAGSNGTQSFAFEGRIRLQLLLDNGQKPFVDVNLATVVAMSSADAVVRGSSDVCRGGQYWPVLDPLGTSLPDQPHPYSAIAEDPAALCIDRQDRTFGPSGWALVTFDVDGVSYRQVNVESLSVQFPGSPLIFLRPPVDAALDGVSEVLWHEQYPFLNFRDLTARLPNQTFTVSADVAPIVGQDYAFAFTPGAIGITGDVTVTCTLQVLKGNATRRVTFTRMIRTDNSLTSTSRFGPPQLVENKPVEEPHSSVLAMAATGGLVAALLFVGIVTAVADTKQPLPKWMPRGLKLVPRRSAKPGSVHKRATVGGIPVEA